jgi:hypothetical protein
MRKKIQAVTRRDKPMDTEMDMTVSLSRPVEAPRSPLGAAVMAALAPPKPRKML